MTARQAALVHTTETTRIRFFMDMLVQLKRPVMLIGNAGLGKTVIINDKLASLGEDYAVSNVPFNFYTTSEMLQRVCTCTLDPSTWFLKANEFLSLSLFQ